MIAKPQRYLPFIVAALLAGCAGGSGTLLGLRKTGAEHELPDALKPPRTIAIKLHASSKLNVDAKGQPLALVTRIYKLRQNAAFEQAPYDTFLNPQKEKDALGADLLDVKEVTLIPGQQVEVAEKVSREAYFVGIVGLFHAPAPQRWRLSFDAAEAEKAGLTIGAHACALSVGSGANAIGKNIKIVSPVHCQ